MADLGAAGEPDIKGASSALFGVPSSQGLGMVAWSG